MFSFQKVLSGLSWILSFFAPFIYYQKNLKEKLVNIHNKDVDVVSDSLEEFDEEEDHDHDAGRPAHMRDEDWN